MEPGSSLTPFPSPSGFCPADDAVLRLYGVAKALAVCDAANEVERIEEEVVLLIQEMGAYVRFYERLVQQQQELLNALAPTADVAGVSFLMRYGTPGHYHPSRELVVADAAVRSGARHYVSVAQQEAMHQLHRGLQLFGSLLAEQQQPPDDEGDGVVDSEGEDAYIPPAEGEGMGA